MENNKKSPPTVPPRAAADQKSESATVTRLVAMPTQKDKRERILEIAMRYFAENGYESARTEDIARESGIAKGSIFQYFQSKQGLFLACYRRAAKSFPRYMEAPREIQKAGFWAILRYWLLRTDSQLRENWVPYRVVLFGNYGTDLKLKREINRFLAAEDPYGTVAFVASGVASGAVRRDVDPEMIVSLLDWTIERFQDALLTEELDPGLFRRAGASEEKTGRRIDQFLSILHGAIGAPKNKRS